MNIISKIVSKFDIVAIQEIQDEQQVTTSRLYYKLNKQYSYILGPRVGYSHKRKEQYAFFYRNDTIRYINSYTYDDRLDEFSREPLIAKFRLANHEALTLINIHTPPKFATREIKKLPKVVIDAIKKMSNINVILLGDLNADCHYFNEKTYKDIFPPHLYVWTIPNELDTTVKITNCTYDRIILTVPLAPFYYNQSGVFNFHEIYKLSYKFATQVSDHYPVWIQLIYN